MTTFLFENFVVRAVLGNRNLLSSFQSTEITGKCYATGPARELRNEGVFALEECSKWLPKSLLGRPLWITL